MLANSHLSTCCCTYFRMLWTSFDDYWIIQFQSIQQHTEFVSISSKLSNFKFFLLSYLAIYTRMKQYSVTFCEGTRTEKRFFFFFISDKNICKIHRYCSILVYKLYQLNQCCIMNPFFCNFVQNNSHNHIFFFCNFVQWSSLVTRTVTN